MDNTYPAYTRELQDRIARLTDSLPDTMRAYKTLHKRATADGVVSRKVKELIALGIALNVNCDGCIAYHVRDALAAGATREEIVETIGVAVMMGGGPAVVYGCQALSALDQFQQPDRPEAFQTAP